MHAVPVTYTHGPVALTHAWIGPGARPVSRAVPGPISPIFPISMSRARWIWMWFRVRHTRAQSEGGETQRAADHGWVARGVAPSGSRRTRRDSLPSPGSHHLDHQGILHPGPVREAAWVALFAAAPTPHGPGDFPIDFSSLIQLLPTTRPGLTGQTQPQTTRPLRSTPITGASSLLRAGPPAHRSRPARLPTFPARAADQAHAASMPDTTWPETGIPAGPCSHSPANGHGFDATLRLDDTSTAVRGYSSS